MGGSIPARVYYRQGIRHKNADEVISWTQPQLCDSRHSGLANAAGCDIFCILNVQIYGYIKAQ